MNVIISISDNGQPREAVPVRAVPWVTGWLVSPKRLCIELSRDHEGREQILADATVYQLEYGNPAATPLMDWDFYSSKLKALEEKLAAEGASKQTDSQKWQIRSTLVLPPGVFMWVDELRERLERFNKWQRQRVGTMHDRAGQLNFCPTIPNDLCTAIMEGFEHSASNNNSGDVAFEDTISLEETIFILRKQLGANDYEIRRWILEGWIQAYRHHRFRDDNSCSKADPYREEGHEIFPHRRFLRAEVEGFDPYTTASDDLDPRNYPEFFIFSALDEDPRQHTDNPSGRWVSYQQAINFLSTSPGATAADAEQVVHQEIGMPGLMISGPGEDEPSAEEGYFDESQIVALASVRFGRPFDGWDAITRQHRARPSDEPALLCEPDTTGMVTWQSVVLNSWPAIVSNYGLKPSARQVIQWVKKHGPQDVIPKEQPDHNSLHWIDSYGEPQTVKVKSVSTRLSEWRKAGKIPK